MIPHWRRLILPGGEKHLNQRHHLPRRRSYLPWEKRGTHKWRDQPGRALLKPSRAPLKSSRWQQRGARLLATRARLLATGPKRTIFAAVAGAAHAAAAHARGLRNQRLAAAAAVAAAAPAAAVHAHAGLGNQRIIGSWVVKGGVATRTPPRKDKGARTRANDDEGARGCNSAVDKDCALGGGNQRIIAAAAAAVQAVAAQRG